MYSDVLQVLAEPAQQRLPRVLPRARGVTVRPRGPAGGMQGERIRREIRIVLQLMLQPDTPTLNDLVALLGVSRRTIFRDIKLLREAGLAVQFDAERGCYFLPDKGMNRFAAKGVSSLSASLKQVPSRPAQPSDQESRDWPFNWQESVALLALIRAAPVPEGTEWRAILRRVDAELKRRVHRAFGQKAGTVSAHAALLAFNPHLSVKALRKFMERCWRCRMEQGNRILIEHSPPLLSLLPPVWI